MIFDECVMARLQERDTSAYVRELRRRGLEPLSAAELEAATGGRGVVVPDGESTEGRGVRIPTLPYVPTEKERREHNAIHYPHRIRVRYACLAGLLRVLTQGARMSYPLAGEFRFD